MLSRKVANDPRDRTCGPFASVTTAAGKRTYTDLQHFHEYVYTCLMVKVKSYISFRQIAFLFKKDNGQNQVKIKGKGLR